MRRRWAVPGRAVLAIAVAIAVAALATGAWLAVREGPPVPAREPDPAPATPAPATEPDESPAEPMPPPGVDLTVVDEETGGPLADVNVFFVALAEDSPPAIKDAFESEKDPLAVAQGCGRVLTTDAAGRVRIPERAGHTLVAARSGALVGALWLHAGMTTERLLLHRPAAATVVVEDSAGRPCPGVAVLLVSDSKYGRSPVARAETDAGGLARFADIAERLPGREGDPLGVTVALAMTTPPFEPVDRRAPPGRPVRLVLPPSGSVRVDLVDAAGAPATDVSYVLLRAPRDGRHDYFVQDEGKFDDATARTEAGVATFRHVGLDQEIEVEVPADGSRATVRHRTSGPSRDGEEISVRVSIGAPRPVVAGRLVDAAGAPIARLQLFADVVEPGHETMDMGECDMRCTSTTDADGRFRFALDRAPGATPSARLHIGRSFHGAKNSWGMRGIALVDLPSTLPSGETSIGDVVFRGTETLVAGVVVDREGRPLRGVAVCAMEVSTSRHVVLECTSMDLGSDMRSPDDDVDVEHTDEQGRFELRGDRSTGRIKVGEETTQGRVEVGAEFDGWFVADEARFDAGATGVRIVMQRAGGIAGAFEIPEGMYASDFEVRIQGDAQRNGDIDYRFGDDGLWALVREDGSFEARNLRPGDARVVVRMGPNRHDEVLRLEDVVVREGEITRDPRLQGFDPAAGRQKFTVSVADREGRPVSGANVHYRPAGADDVWKQVTTVDGGTAVVPAPKLPVELVVTRRGFRYAIVASARADTNVVLGKSTPTIVRVRLAEYVALPDPPHGFSASLRWLGTSASGSEADGRHPLDVANFDARFDRDRVVTFETCDPGRYRVALMLWSALPGGGAAGGDLPTVPETIEVTVPEDGGEVEVSVAVDAAVLRQRTSDRR